MKARTKVLLTSVASIAMCASIAVGGTYALFTDKAMVNVAVTSGTVDVEANIVSGSLSTYSRGILQTNTAEGEMTANFANDPEGVYGATLNDDGSLTLLNITPGDKAEFEIAITNNSNVDIAYRVTASIVDTMGTNLSQLLVWTSEVTAWTFVEGNTAVAAPVKVSVELPEEVTYDDLAGVENAIPAEYEANVVFLVEAIQGNGGVYGEVNVFNGDQVASALEGANETGAEVIVELPGDIDNRLTVGEDVNAVLDLNDNALNNSLVNKGTVDVSGGTIVVDDFGFQNEGTASVENVTMTAGNAGNYSNIARGADAVTTYENVEITSGGGGIGATNGAKVVFNSGKISINTNSTSSRYMFYLEGEGSEIVINGGEFSFVAGQNNKRAYVYAPAGTSVTINGGTFAAFKARSGLILGDGNIVISGGTFGFDPSAWVPAGYQVVEDTTAKTWTVSANVESMTEVLKAGGDITLYGDVLGVNNTTNGYGSTMVVQKGGVLDGNGYTLAADKASGTWDSTLATYGGTIKNLTITKGFRGIFIKSSTETVYLDNVVINGTTYTISCDSSNGHGLVATNSKFYGWTSYAATIGDVSFTNCTFGFGNGYQYIRPYAATTFTNCEFNAGMGLDLRAGMTFTNCTFAGQPLTMELFAELVEAGTINTRGNTIIVNGVVFGA